jgi:hypothetical protein
MGSLELFIFIFILIVRVFPLLAHQGDLKEGRIRHMRRSHEVAAPLHIFS